ncbi:hypothetical protein Trydic_g11540, partial [Trypoxylus dichotomus]
YEMLSDVLQGSNLGPLLFTLYMDDLLTTSSCPALAYGDDLKIYSIVTGVDSSILLQWDLGVVADWCERNQLQLKFRKCCNIQKDFRFCAFIPAP